MLVVCVNQNTLHLFSTFCRFKKKSWCVWAKSYMLYLLDNFFDMFKNTRFNMCALVRTNSKFGISFWQEQARAHGSVSRATAQGPRNLGTSLYISYNRRNNYRSNKAHLALAFSRLVIGWLCGCMFDSHCSPTSILCTLCSSFFDVPIEGMSIGGIHN
jgi:hypothetical protein